MICEVVNGAVTPDPHGLGDKNSNQGDAVRVRDQCVLNVLCLMQARVFMEGSTNGGTAGMTSET